MSIFMLVVLCLSQAAPTVCQPSKSKFSLSYAENPFNSHKLSLLEEKLATEIAQAPSKLLCSESILQYFHNFRTSIFLGWQLSAEERATRVVENGLLWYKMLSRVVNLLKSLKIDNECNRNVRQTIHNLFTDANLTLPEEHDLRVAILGILRIQYVYGYNATSEMRLGILGDRNTGVKLDFTECLQIAQRAILLQLNALAYQWLAAAAEETGGNENKMVELNRAWLTLAYQLGINSTDILHPIAIGKSQNSHFAYHSFSWYATCRGESAQNFENPKLRCYYQRTKHWYLTLNPAKVEILATEPLILLYHELFGDEQVEFLKNSAVVDETVDIFKGRNLTVPKDQEEAVTEFGKFETSVHFTSDVNVYRSDPSIQDPIILRIEEKMDMIAGFNVELMVTNIRVYGSLGSHYDIHHDTLQQSNVYSLEEGDRLANFLVFLADTEMGGNLGFPVPGVYAKPKTGNAVFWYNILDDGNIEFRTFHMGCPVILGKKQMMCTSYFANDNVWTYPCPKERTPVKYSDACMQLTTKLGFVM